MGLFLRITFESDVEDVGQYINAGKYGLCHVSRKNDRFASHYQQRRTDIFETLLHEALQPIDKKWVVRKIDIEIRRAAHYVTETMIEDFSTSENTGISL